MLVNIYGSKELFVNEYCTLLSNRLLAHCNYETEREIRNLELLKLRFGETALHKCEVMLKDIGDSKRINGLLRGESAEGEEALNGADFPVNAIILSAAYWPSFKNEVSTPLLQLQLPPDVSTRDSWFLR
jgi:anaphase-promoting complex subunit 2